MEYPYKLLIAYRPFQITDPTLVATVSSDATMQKVYEGLCSEGFDAEILTVGPDVEDVLLNYDPRETLIFNYCDGYIDDPCGYDPVTQVFEKLGFAFSGADDATLQWSVDKAITKTRLVANGIPTPDYQIYENSHINDWNKYPALVKPSRLHGSVGILPDSVVETPAQLVTQIERILDMHAQPALVEDFIEGLEYRVGVWGNGELEVLPLSRIIFEPPPGQRFELKDFATKWGDSGMDLEIPAAVPPHVLENIEKMVKASYRAVDMRDYGAVDVRLRGDQPYVIDPNQNPDISEENSFVYMAESIGKNYGQMLAHIVQLAAHRLPV